MTFEEKREVLQEYCNRIGRCEKCKLFYKYGYLCCGDFKNSSYPDYLIEYDFETVFGNKPKEELTPTDNINSPSHYTYGKIECIDFIQDKGLNFCLGNVIKYIVRAGHKHSDSLTDKDKAIEDLKKAKKYLEFEIKEMEENNGN